MNERSSIHEADYIIDRRQRLRLLVIALPAMIGLMILLLLTIKPGGDYFYRETLFAKELLYFAVGSLGISCLAFVMTYLQTGFKRSAEVNYQTIRYQRELEASRATERVKLGELADALRVELGEQVDALRVELQRVRDEIESATSRASNIEAGDRSELVADLKAQLSAEANAAILSDLKVQVAAGYAADVRDRDLLQRFDESRSRLFKEVEALGRRGNLNLSFGALITLTGLVLLGMSVFSEMSEAKDWWALVSHFVPRLTLVIMIELFAFFFLSLYRTSLEEIKYFQNELTNVEAKQIALRAALSYGDQPMVADIVAKLATTERNHILSKNQTTVELEKTKIDKDSKSEFVKYVAEFFQKKA